MPIRYEWTPEQKQQAEAANQWLMDALSKVMPGSAYMGAEQYQPLAQPIANAVIPNTLEDAIQGAFNQIGMNPMKIFYHGTKGPLNLSEGVLYLSPRKSDAMLFADDAILSHNKQGIPGIYKIDAKKGKTLDINKLVNYWLETGADIDNKIYNLSNNARQKGYRYFEFNHPSIMGDEFNARVSLYPNQDLNIIDLITKGK